MDSRLTAELGPAFLRHGPTDVVIQYGSVTHSENIFPAHSRVLRQHSSTFEWQFATGVYVPGSTITLPHGNEQAVEDMLRYFYLDRYALLRPANSTSIIRAFGLVASQHAAVYGLAHQENYCAVRLTVEAYNLFDTHMDDMLKWLDRPENNTAKNAVRLLRVILGLVYDDNDTWVEFDRVHDRGAVPPMAEWPLRNLVCETAARIWVRAQRWNITLAANQTEDREERWKGDEGQIEIAHGDTGEDVVKKELAKVCWNNKRFAQDFATWMLKKGEVSITLHHNVMRRSRF